MAKDDYNVLVYKILIYLYACLKRKIAFNETVFKSIIYDMTVEKYKKSPYNMNEKEAYIRTL